MKARCSALIKLLFIAAFLLLVSRCAFADVLDKTRNVSGIIVQYKVVLPNGYNPGKAYPAVLAFPGGSQNMDTVEGTAGRLTNESKRTKGVQESTA